ncbi:MAG: integrin alpha [Candidatus Limnocylindrales bacterium]
MMLRFTIRQCVVPVALLLFVLAGALPVSAQGVSVTSADPNFGELDTASLNVRVKGKNFAQGAVADFLLDDDTTGGITVNSTTFVSSTEVIANVTIASGASLTLFDIRVRNANGRTGRGSDLFQVVEKGARAGGACTPGDLPAGIVELARLNPSLGFALPTNTAIEMKTYATTVNGVQTLLVAATSGPRVEVFFLTRDAGTGVLIDATNPHRTLTVSTTATLADAIAIGDANDDGTPDIVAADPSRVVLFVGSRSVAGGPISFGSGIPLVLTGAPTSYRRAMAMGNLESTAGDEIVVGQQGGKAGKTITPGALTVFQLNGLSVTTLRKLVPTVTPALKYDDGYPRTVALADVVGDGNLDIITAAASREVGSVTDAGEVWVFPGPFPTLNGAIDGASPIVLRATVPTTADHLGSKVAIGDVFGIVDGGVDILAATSWSNSQTRGEVFRSPFAPLTTPDSNFTFQPEPGTMATGWATTGIDVGDINGDTYTDVVVGTPNAASSNACSNVGAVYIFLGNGAGGWRRLRMDPSTYNGTFNAYGWSVALGNLNGLRLLLVGEQGADVNGVDSAGQVYVYRVDNP